MFKPKKGVKGILTPSIFAPKRGYCGVIETSREKNFLCNTSNCVKTVVRSYTHSVQLTRLQKVYLLLFDSFFFLIEICHFATVSHSAWMLFTPSGQLRLDIEPSQTQYFDISFEPAYGLSFPPKSKSTPFE